MRALRASAVIVAATRTQVTVPRGGRTRALVGGVQRRAQGAHLPWPLRSFRSMCEKKHTRVMAARRLPTHAVIVHDYPALECGHAATAGRSEQRETAHAASAHLALLCRSLRARRTR